MSLTRGQLPESDYREKLREKVDGSFEDYRKSGLALMATVIALSSGGLVMLIQDQALQTLAFLFFIPISLSILQQLFHYFGSKEMAHSILEGLRYHYATEDADVMDAYIGQDVHFKYSQLYFGISDNLSWISCLSLGVVCIYLLTILAKFIIVSIIILVVLVVLLYWIRQRGKLKKEIALKNYNE